MHILGLSSGTKNGTSETLLKIALKEAAAASPDVTISFLRLPEVAIPGSEQPGIYDKRPALGANSLESIGQKIDDRPAVLEAILACDALIVASPIYTRQAAGVLKFVCDRTLGPYVDAAAVEKAIAGMKSGDPRFKDTNPEQRVLKPRVGALIAAGGATSVEWTSLALPMLHQSVFSLHIRVVDQMVARGVPNPGVALADEALPARAKRLGRNVASQLGKTFEEAEYLGDETGGCPHCRLNTIVVHGTATNDVDCAVCGAKGRLIVGDSGKIQVQYFKEPRTSVITMEGKRMHMEEIEIVARQTATSMADTEDARAEWKLMDQYKVELPSARAHAS
ncbi:flavoprotein-like protein [Aspergillus pseudoustus]|uniref:Flavoprotein-like protein n=1 Tax=Aspergillus pseudoustus TaxID=1810923 RepID=A0ABR4II55_9EURO